MDSTIILNASGDGFDASSNAFYVNPLRSATQSNVLYYNTSTKEITYNTSEAATDISGIWTFDSSNNFYGPSGASMNDPQGSAEKNTFGGVSVATSVSFSGFNNTAFGYEAFQLGGDSEENVAIGGQALKSVETGGNNTAVGYQALSLATSSGNTAVGTTAGVGLTTGENNTIMGAAGGEGLTTGSNNLVLGYAAFSTAAGDTSGCICLNATGTDFSPALSDMSSQFFVKPIRSSSQPNALYYEPTSGEITYDLSGGSGGGGGGGSPGILVIEGPASGTGLSGETGWPTTMPSMVKITLIGAGGGGGGGTAATQAGGGGGGGGAWLMWTSDPDLMSTLSWFLGSGGAGGAAGTQGIVGGNSQLGSRVATGGQAGFGGSSGGLPGHGGVPTGTAQPTGTAISLNGNTGGYDWTGSTTLTSNECLEGGAGAGLGGGGPNDTGSSAGYGNGGTGGPPTGGGAGVPAPLAGQNGVMIVEWW